jgi:rhomboid protease GluP
MPKHIEQIVAAGLDAPSLMAISYKTLETLGWKINLATENILIARTPQTWKRYSNEITIKTENEKLSVTSNMIHGEIFDAMGRTKKDVAQFITAFEEVKIQYSGTTDDVTGKIASLKQETAHLLEAEIKESAQVDLVMNLSKGSMTLTYVIIALNTLIFVLMALNGAGIFEANSVVHIRWGSNYSFLTQSGDWWRLITNTFIHFGIIHLLMNMYVLYMAGVYLEPMLGKVKFISAYFATGIIASLVSLWWHKDGVNSAGASGAIFGLYGLFLALLVTKLIPEKVRKALLQSTVIFVAYNLIYGAKGGVDNSAHIGGLLSGFIIGQFYAWVLKKEKNEQKITWAGPVVLALSAAAAFAYLQQNQISASERKSILLELNNTKYSDYEKYNKQLVLFDEVHERAMSVYKNTNLSDAEFRDTLENVTIKYWNEAEDDIMQTRNMNVSASLKQKSDKLIEYVQTRKKEIQLLLKIIDTPDNADLMNQLKEIRIRANALFEEALKLQ